MRTAREKMLDDCMAHANRARRQAKMKGMDPADIGAAMVAEALVAMFGIELIDAFPIGNRCIGYAAELINRQQGGAPLNLAAEQQLIPEAISAFEQAFAAVEQKFKADFLGSTILTPK
ncbi:MAG: hypothetical protein HXX15_21140 [Rhodopseudomonas sp.]|uniref:hypothetical protein n=1 Tax=Rhodopseudomonas sp. TaxID=1078 RepID=UPI00181378F9|nr:hypothetical protein [Rhodopseudomonas sp.]NVN88592.1 hypothetical protein [Rhodopseudomonas sp.]